MKSKIIGAMARISYGIYVLTSKKGDENHGMIASWVSQVSHDPPLVMVAVRKNRRMHPVVEEAGAFALHVLDRNDTDTIDRFKLPSSAERFKGADCITLKTGCPILKRAVAYMDCRLATTLAAGDHTMFVGEVIAADFSEEGTPMTSADYGKVYLGDS